MSEPTLFEKIAAGEIPSDKVHEDEHVYAFRDIKPEAPTHVLVIPRRPIPSLAAADAGDQELLGHLMLSIAKIATQEGLDDEGYRVVTNVGAHGGQTVFHLHFHLLGGRALSWPPG